MKKYKCWFDHFIKVKLGLLLKKSSKKEFFSFQMLSEHGTALIVNI